MERRRNYTKGTPDVNARSTPHRFYGDFFQGHVPRLGFETYEADGGYQDRF
jgi:hypothetical protein